MMITPDMAATVPAWFGRVAATVRFYERHEGAGGRRIFEVDTGRSAWLDADGVTMLRDLCNEFLADAEVLPVRGVIGGEG